ncbi:MAG: phosphoribosylformimino-5-aminoimidazole carboxamide ribotide isomerase [Gemmatimonadota bacterium]|nr:phosphoribosylformimino-5-aminoimidazole carboxamide ribotide isomerase [Gemmatimonadota bacterium]
MNFRPCIDLRGGRVVQIVGGSLRNGAEPATNFETGRSAADYAKIYRADNLPGGHVVMLGPGNESAALSALSAFPGGLQVGGGIRPENARRYLDAGASHVIVTSYVFRDGRIDTDRLDRMVRTVGRNRLVLDLSCRRRGDAYLVVTDLWQRFTGVRVDGPTLNRLSEFCDGFLVHGVDAEGKRQGIEDSLVELLGAESPIDVTYAGGARGLEDLDRVEELGQGRVGLTIGSALDIFGGDVPYEEVVAWQRRRERPM